ncbi:hypothetical protein GGR56DRAFT_402696 [Xylariaceae sp. FL0804]|nr:hypothetical protein GGR56DRAFT_402696 [Xylariaceae sp. FL0804]
MESAFKEERSHFEPDSPTSVHGARGVDAASGTEGRGSGDVSSDDHVQEKEEAAVPLNKRQKVKRHCGQFWLWYLIGSIIFLAIFLPILFEVIIPAIVQRIVSQQALPVNGGSFIAISPNQLNVSLSTSLNTPLPAVIEPTTLFLYNKNTTDFSPFLNITLPKQHVDGKTTVNVDGQVVTITNETELVKWFNNVFDLAESDLSVRGKSSVHLGALHSKAKIDKTVEVQSLNQLSGFGIQDLELVLPAASNGTNIQGTLNLPNWGSLTIGLGDVALNLMAGGVRIGLIHIDNVSLPPGNNTCYFTGKVFFGTVIQNIGTILTSQASALSNGNIELVATGNATTVNGQHIPFVEAILNNKQVSSTTPIVKLLGDVVSSFTGGGGGVSGASLTTLVGDVFGNSTLLEDILDNWNTTSTTTTSASTSSSNSTVTRRSSSAKAARKRAKALAGPVAAWGLLKMGLKAARQ